MKKVNLKYQHIQMDFWFFDSIIQDKQEEK